MWFPHHVCPWALSLLPSFHAHLDGQRAGTVDWHHPQHSRVSLHPPTYESGCNRTSFLVGRVSPLDSSLSFCVCPDVNECSQQNGGCNQICYNKPGSFHCACYSGYSLSTDGRTCQGEALDAGPIGFPRSLSSSPCCPPPCSSPLLLLQLSNGRSWQSHLLCWQWLAPLVLEGREGGRRSVL